MNSILHHVKGIIRADNNLGQANFGNERLHGHPERCHIQFGVVAEQVALRLQPPDAQ